LLKLLWFEALIVGVKRDDEVIRTLASGAGVLCLDGVDELAGELEVVGPGDARKIRCEEPGGARLGVSALDVVCQVLTQLLNCAERLISKLCETKTGRL